MGAERDQVGPGWFVILHACWGLSAYTFFMKQLFGRLRLPDAAEPLSLELSHRVLLSLVLACTALGLLAAVNGRRNGRHVALNVLTPYGIYIVLRAAPQEPVWLYATAALCGGALAAYAVILFTAPIRRKDRRAYVLKRRFGQLARAGRALPRIALCLVAAVSIGGAALGLSALRPEPARLQADDSIPLSALDPWEDQLQGLDEAQWGELSLAQRVELMQLAADIETRYLGLPDKLQVSCRDLSPNTAGSYSHDTRTVSISRDHLLYDPAIQCLDTVLHEAYHSYQRHLCALYEDADSAYRPLLCLRGAKGYISEFEHYRSGLDDYDAYYMQTCERDAREYAVFRSVEYERILTAP